MSPQSILVIDDDEAVTTTFARMLRLHGYDVRTVTDAAVGLDEAARQRPDAILLDLRMPITDGLTFLRQLRAHERGRPTPVAIVTGDYLLDAAVTIDAEQLGATIHFKPLWLEDLIAITHDLVSP